MKTYTKTVGNDGIFYIGGKQNGDGGEMQKDIRIFN
jgi:hypothetical protein